MSKILAGSGNFEYLLESLPDGVVVVNRQKLLPGLAQTGTRPEELVDEHT